jgi:hypothetical protein
MKIVKIITCCLLSIVFWGCELEDAPLVLPPDGIDYRDVYTGDFAFFSYHWHHSMGNYYYADTVKYIGHIAPWEGSDSLLQIRYREGTPSDVCGTSWNVCITPRVHSGGLLTYATFMQMSHSSFSGAFNRQDAVDVELGMGGLGSQGGYIIHGVRVQ